MSYSEGDANPPAPNFGGLPSAPKITHQSQPNGNYVLLLSMSTNYLASYPSSATSTQMMDSQ